MEDMWDSELSYRIHSFMSRKDREFPELRLFKKWYDIKQTPRRRGYGETRKREAY